MKITRRQFLALAVALPLLTADSAPRMALIALGGSITAARAGYTRYLAQWILGTYAAHNPRLYRVALPKQSAWEEFFKLDQVIKRNPTVILLDWAANNHLRSVFQDVSEAIIRQFQRACPGASLLMPLFPQFPGDLSSPVYDNAPVIAELIQLANHYGVAYVDFGALMAGRVAAGQNTLTDWYAPGDGTHPRATGARFIAQTLQGILTSAFLTGSAATALPAPLRPDAAYYENMPTFMRWGMQPSVKTGSWTRSGRYLQSSERGATIGWAGRWRAFGVACSANQKSAVIVNIDSGGWQVFDPLLRRRLPRLIDVLPEGEHQVLFRLQDGSITFEQFVAV